ncbi:hypothetical protein [Methylomonas sp. AM2-LC]|uniref:hypothetical protein n=1 Tax=Methylomonas sp. AM2-LC TaxID=3153301 RepID=UPI003267513E
MNKVRFLFFIVLLFPFLAEAEESKLQKFQAMNECMMKVDQTQLQSLADRSIKLMADASALCDSGNRDAAKALDESFTKQEEATPVTQAIKKCGEIFKNEQNKDKVKAHICDRIKLATSPK